MSFYFAHDVSSGFEISSIGHFWYELVENHSPCVSRIKTRLTYSISRYDKQLKCKLKGER